MPYVSLEYSFLLYHCFVLYLFVFQIQVPVSLIVLLVSFCIQFIGADLSVAKYLRGWE